MEYCYNESGKDNKISIKELKNLVLDGHVVSFHDARLVCGQCGREYNVTRNFAEAPQELLEYPECPYCTLEKLHNRLKRYVGALENKQNVLYDMKENMNAKLSQLLRLNKNSVKQDINALSAMEMDNSQMLSYYRGLLDYIQVNYPSIESSLNTPLEDSEEFHKWHSFVVFFADII